MSKPFKEEHPLGEQVAVVDPCNGHAACIPARD